MTARHDRLSELCYAAEGLSGTASAAALRQIGSLASTAPTGRMFGAIATLTEFSADAASKLAEGIDRLNHLAAGAIPDLGIDATDRRKQG